MQKKIILFLGIVIFFNCFLAFSQNYENQKVLKGIQILFSPVSSIKDWNFFLENLP
jgi:hypothetical protein